MEDNQVLDLPSHLFVDRCALDGGPVRLGAEVIKVGVFGVFERHVHREPKNVIVII